MTENAAQTINIRVRYAETDQMGVVYHANYFTWFEVGAASFWGHRQKFIAILRQPVFALP